jgi:hypothetical protein
LLSILNFAISNDDKAWKAGWILNRAVSLQIINLDQHYVQIWSSIRGKPANQRRELLRLLENCNLNNKTSGHIFDVAVDCWIKIGAQPSSRFVAFRLMLKVAEQHGELRNEVKLMCASHMLQGLSPGIKRAIQKRIQSL